MLLVYGATFFKADMYVLRPTADVMEVLAGVNDIGLHLLNGNNSRRNAFFSLSYYSAEQTIDEELLYQRQFVHLSARNRQILHGGQNARSAVSPQHTQSAIYRKFVEAGTPTTQRIRRLLRSYFTSHNKLLMCVSIETVHFRQMATNLRLFILHFPISIQVLHRTAGVQTYVYFF